MIENCVQRAGIPGIGAKIHNAGGVIAGEHLIPRLAAVHSLEDAAVDSRGGLRNRLPDNRETERVRAY